jgi:hypothetical protein
VVGFDDIHLSEFTIPPLTTVQMSQHNLAMIAFHALLDEVESQNSFREPRKYELITKPSAASIDRVGPAAESSGCSTGYEANRETETGSGACISLSSRHSSEGRIALLSLR